MMFSSVASLAMAGTSLHAGDGEEASGQLSAVPAGAGWGAVMVYADVIVYGATPAGVIAAAEAASMGWSVAILGGWRERHLGGMIAGGLGWTDILDPAVIGGRAKEMLRDASSHAAFPFAVDPALAEFYFMRLVQALNIPVYWTSGVTVAEKEGSHIRRIVTADARAAVGRVYIDASYEGDLLAKAGVSYAVGRDAADQNDQANGFRGLQTDFGSNNHQFSLRGRPLRIDPFVTPADPTSGLINGVKPWTNQAVGAADHAVQGYNFRLTMSNSPEGRIDFPSSPPNGYNHADYEALFRYIEAIGHAGLRHGRDWTFKDDLVIASPIGKVYDVNSRGGFSLDPFGLSWTYPEASYSDRELIWKAHETYVRGFFYALGWDPDPRIPPTLQAEVRTWGLARGYYTRPAFGDAAGWPYQLYVREARRMQSDLIWTGADLNIPVSQPPRNRDTIAMASYREDSHHVQRLAVEGPDQTWRLWNEGNFEIEYDSQNSHAPIPYGIITPRRSECANLLVPFCVSATHQAFSAIRTELTAIALGQASGAAAAITCALGVDTFVQDVPYITLRRHLEKRGAVLKKPTGLAKWGRRLGEVLESLG